MALKLNNYVIVLVIFMNFTYNKSVIIKHKTPIKMRGVILWNDLS